MKISKKSIPPDLFEVLLYGLLSLFGLTGAGLAIFMGKVYAAFLIALLGIGIFLRFKRRRARY